MPPMVNPEPVSPRGSPPPVVTGKHTFVERAPAGGASRLRLRGRGPVGAVRKRRVRYKSRPWEGASMTWRYLALSKSIPPRQRTGNEFDMENHALSKNATHCS